MPTINTQARSVPWSMAAVFIVLTAAFAMLHPMRATAAPTLNLPFPAGAAYTITGGPGSNHHMGAYAAYNQYAVDFGMPANSPVAASASGTVFFAGWKDRFSGNEILIDHGGNECTQYVHLNSVGVGKGQRVAAGQIVGRSGSTGTVSGPHLHWALVYCSGPNAGKNITVPRTVEQGTSYLVGARVTSRNGAAAPAPASNPQHLKEPVAAGCTADAQIIARRNFSGMALEVRYSPKCGTNWLRIQNMRGSVRFYLKSDAYPQEVTSTQNGTGGTHWTNQVHAPGATCITAEATSLSTGKGTGRFRICG
ncbi:peptidoglycan DD-metalloendopeptidase family protein (plasmid) [Rhodococcus pyridinivorans]|uniref:peptidoglycan DD-metalloendopeptidase family protein n=1 Tax=Rhodococcus pyridinivorans TaxID=103816 RepID=UPI002164457B|nr:peptidoglycan DD-metalloendopeptidase family protein [Rhodococcus pyridinivorans]UVT27722.1 peptidoglycan DD-metalloendopeptidase family protein [Rhodococcus pyridinivorans]